MTDSVGQTAESKVTIAVLPGTYAVEPPNNRHIRDTLGDEGTSILSIGQGCPFSGDRNGGEQFVHCSEVVPSSVEPLIKSTYKGRSLRSNIPISTFLISDEGTTSL